MVGPTRSGDVDSLAVGVEALEECAAYSESTGTRYGLGDGDTIFFDGR